MIFQHFHTEQFKIYDVESGQITKMQLINTEGLRHGALSTFLTQVEINILICGSIGGTQATLSHAEISLYGKITGKADEAVHAYLARNLNYKSVIQCDEHFTKIIIVKKTSVVV